MARLPRIEVAGVAQHVIQRGNNRQACFLQDRDREFYLGSLKRALNDYDCDLHAYVLMSNHVHMLMTPGEAGRVARVMQSLGRRYVRYFNETHERTGTLWEGRYRSSLVDSEHYALACYRYIELNPVRAGLVATPDRYRWSSYLCNALGEADYLISQHPTYEALGSSDVARFQNYRALFKEAITASELQAIRSHSNQGKVLGSQKFRKEIENRLGRNVSYRTVGRPRNVL